MAELADIKSTLREFITLARHQLSSNSIEEAENTARAVVSMDNKSAKGWQLLGDVLAELPGRRAEATQAYNKALDIEPDLSVASGGIEILTDRETASAVRPVRDDKIRMPYMVPDDGKEEAITRAKTAEESGDFASAERAWKDALSIDPSDTWIWTQYAHLLSVHLQRFDDAEKAYRLALEVDPTDDWVWGKLGIMLADFMGRVDEGQEMLRHAISLDDTEGFYHGWLGWTLYRQSNKNDEAASALEYAVKLWPDYQWAHFHLGYVRSISGKEPKKAEKSFLKALALEPNDIPVLFNLAGLYEEQLNAPRKALKYFEQIIKIDPDDASTLRRIGMLYQGALPNAEKAEAAYRSAIALFPHDYDVLTRLGWLLWETNGEVDEGLALIEEAYEYSGKSSWVATHLGQLYYIAKNDQDTAVRYFEAAIKADPANDWALAYLGSLLYEDEAQLAKAIEYIQEAIKLSPDYGWAWYHLGRIYAYHAELPHQAKEALAKAIELDPNHMQSLFDYVWLLSEMLHDPYAAAKYTSKLIDLGGEVSLVNTLVGRVYRRIGADDLAVTYLHKGVELDPEDHFAWHEYGEMVLYELGDLEQGEEAMLRAQIQNPHCGSIDIDMAFLRSLMGRSEEAASHHLKALDCDNMNVASYQSLARYAALITGDMQQAEQMIAKALESDDSDPASWALYAALMHKWRRDGEFCEAEQQLLEILPTNVSATTLIENALIPKGLKVYIKI